MLTKDEVRRSEQALGSRNWEVEWPKGIFFAEMSRVTQVEGTAI
jgi:hypothetical protein